MLEDNILLFWCCYFKYRYIKLDLVTVGRFWFRFSCILQARRKGGSKGSIEPPLEVNNGVLKTQTVDFKSAF